MTCLLVLRLIATVPYLAKLDILEHSTWMTLDTRIVFEFASLATWILFTYLSYMMPKWDLGGKGPQTFRQAMAEALCMLFFVWGVVNMVTVAVCMLISK